MIGNLKNAKLAPFATPVNVPTGLVAHVQAEYHGLKIGQ